MARRTPEQGPIQERARRTREQILEVAAHAFAEDGYEGTSLSRLIRDSGLTKGAFYFHFDSKAELALATLRYKQEELMRGITAQAGAQPNAGRQLAATLRARARLLQADRSLRCVLTLSAELGGRSGPGSEYTSYQETTLEMIEGLVRRGQSEGVFRADLEPRPTAETIFAAVIGIDQLSDLLADRSDLARRTEHLLQLLAPGLGAGT